MTILMFLITPMKRDLHEKHRNCARELEWKIGNNAYKEWIGTVGKFGDTYERRLRLLEIDKKHNLTIAKTLQRH